MQTDKTNLDLECAVKAQGFPADTSNQDVVFFFAKCGALNASKEKHVIEDSDSNTIESTYFIVEFLDFKHIITVLSKPIEYLYDNEHVISVSLTRKESSMEAINEHLYFPKSVYTCNKVIKIQSISKFITAALLKLFFEKFASVVRVNFNKSELMSVGYVTLKAPKAKEVVKLVQREASLEKEGIHAIEALQGQEEYLFWEITKEKQKLQSSTCNSSLVINNQVSRGLKRKGKSLPSIEGSPNTGRFQRVYNSEEHKKQKREFVKRRGNSNEVRRTEENKVNTKKMKVFVDNADKMLSNLFESMSTTV